MDISTDAAETTRRGVHRAISLEPLGPGHVEAYDRLFRGDPRIAALAGLPQLRSRQETAAWIDGGARKNGAEPFAVVHEDRGLVGAIALVRHREIGTFWFWIGDEHRSRGFGSRALALLKETARRPLFAFVVSTNGPSRRVLEAQGFCATGLAVLPRREGYLVYADEALATAPRLREAIAALLSSIRSRLWIAAPPRRTREAVMGAVQAEEAR